MIKYISFLRSVLPKKILIVVPSDKNLQLLLQAILNLTCFNANDGTVTIAAQNFKYYLRI
jgi:hypothetical protein